jgi:hypothetical protein
MRGNLLQAQAGTREPARLVIRLRHESLTSRWKQGSLSPGESDDTQVHVMMVTGLSHNEQPGDLEDGEGAGDSKKQSLYFQLFQIIVTHLM